MENKLLNFVFKNKLNLVLRLNVNEKNEFEFEKLVNKLNQNGVDEGSNLDLLLEKFANGLNSYSFLKKKSFLICLDVINIKILTEKLDFINELFFYLKFDLNSIIKHFLDLKNLDHVFYNINKKHLNPLWFIFDYRKTKFKVIKKINRTKVFFFSLLNSKFLSLEEEILKFNDLVFFVNNLSNHFLTFKKRLFFKNRKVNFRMKLKKKKFEDY